MLLFSGLLFDEHRSQVQQALTAVGLNARERPKALNRFTWKTDVLPYLWQAEVKDNELHLEDLKTLTEYLSRAVDGRSFDVTVAAIF